MILSQNFKFLGTLSLDNIVAELMSGDVFG